MTYKERKEQVKSYLGKTVDIKIDRPIGYVHHKEKYSLHYPINYGYIPDVLGGDGEELDVYLLGVTDPVKEYRVRIIGIVHRHNDVEDKLIAAPEGMVFYQNEIAEAIDFQEQYYETHVEALFEKSAGAVLYTKVNGQLQYLLIESSNVGFPKGHIEKGESERKAALREIFEETSVSAEIIGDFREEINYVMPNGKNKKVVYFLAEFYEQTPHHNQGFEYNEYLLLPIDCAVKALTFDKTKEILVKADQYIKNHG